MDRSILVAEDCVLIREANKFLLNRLNVSFKQVTNGIEAVEEMSCNHYDICFMDIDMPVLNGIEATKKIIASNPAAKIIGFSSNENYRQQCMNIGMIDFLVKPASTDTIENKLKRHIG